MYIYICNYSSTLPSAGSFAKAMRGGLVVSCIESTPLRFGGNSGECFGRKKGGVAEVLTERSSRFWFLGDFFETFGLAKGPLDP